MIMQIKTIKDLKELIKNMDDNYSIEGLEIEQIKNLIDINNAYNKGFIYAMNKYRKD